LVITRSDPKACLCRLRRPICKLTGGLFLPEGQFDAAMSEDFLEHVQRPVAARILGDVFRALRPGGTLRIAIADLRDIIRIYLEAEQHPAANDAIQRTFGMVSGRPCELHNYATRGEGHVYMYDRAEIN
jgi:predicted SAM-dependent methyltransferase